MKYNQLQNLVVWNPGKWLNFFRKALEMIIFAKKWITTLYIIQLLIIWRMVRWNFWDYWQRDWNYEL